MLCQNVCVSQPQTLNLMYLLHYLLAGFLIESRSVSLTIVSFTQWLCTLRSRSSVWSAPGATLDSAPKLLVLSPDPANVRSPPVAPAPRDSQMREPRTVAALARSPIPIVRRQALDGQTRGLLCTRRIKRFGTCPFLACAVERRRFPVGASPTRQPLQPEAIGAVMEATKWLKPSISVSRIGDSASVQAATRVNAEQASKRTMCRPTRLPYRGRLIRPGGMSEA